MKKHRDLQKQPLNFGDADTQAEFGKLGQTKTDRVIFDQVPFNNHIE
jgi:hypothetical protein